MEENSQTRFDRSVVVDSIRESETAADRLNQNATAEELADGLWNRVGRVQKRVERLVWVDAASSLVCLIVLIFFFGALADWWIRPSSWWGRGLVFALVVAAIVGASTWFVWNRLRKRISRLSVARRLEAVFPSMGDRLSSAVAMIESRRRSARSLSSEQLTDAAVRQAASELDRLEPERVIDWRGSARSFAMALIMVAMVLLFCFWRPAGASLVAKRLFAPTVDAQWPKEHNLILENVPERVHAGAELELFIRDTIGTLPSDTELIVRPINGQTVSVPLRITGEAAVGNFEVGSVDVDVRAFGGDDLSMPWRRIEVMDAPAIKAYQLVLTPPSYLDQQPVEVAESQFEVIAGTRVRVSAELTLPVESAELVLVQRGQSPTPIAVDVSSLGRELFVDALELNSTTEFFFRWTDTNGLVGESDRRWRATVDEDSPPRVTLAVPESDAEVTTQVDLKIAGVAIDDFGLLESWFEVRHVQTATQGRIAEREMNATTAEVQLEWTGGVEELLTLISDSSDQATGDETASESKGPELPLAQVPLAQVPLEGTTFEIVAVAIDTAGQRGQSTTRRIRIISQQAMRQAIARQQSDAMQQLMEARTQQEIALEQTEAAQSRVGGSSEQRQAAADRIQAAEVTQQAVNRNVMDSSSSAASQLRQASETAERNGLSNQALNELVESVERIAAGSLPAAKDALNNAAESLAAGSSEESKQQLDTAAAAQQDALEQLENLVQSMRRDDAKRAANDELSELAAAQARLTQQGRQTSDALNPEEERRRLAQKQRELARETEQLAQELRDLADELTTETGDADGTPDSIEADRARAAADALERGLADGEPAESDTTSPQNSAADTMRQAAEELARGREGRAESLQQGAQEQLDEARRQLSGSTGRGDNDQQSDENNTQSFAVGVQQALRRQDLLVDQLVNEPEMKVETLAEEQSAIADLTQKVASDPQAPPGFEASLEDATKDMQTAAALLKRQSERRSAEEAATAARQRLRFVVESLLSDPSESSQDGDNRAEEDTNGDDQQESQQGIPTSTLKLLRATQEFIRTRTEDIVRRQADVDALATDPVRASRLEAVKRQLAEEQTRLVERIEELVREKGESNGEN